MPVTHCQLDEGTFYPGCGRSWLTTVAGKTRRWLLRPLLVITTYHTLGQLSSPFYDRPSST